MVTPLSLNKRYVMLKRLFYSLIITIFSLVVALGLGVFLLNHTASQGSIQVFLHSHVLELAMFRWVIYLVLLFFWQPFIRGCSHLISWHPEMIEMLIQLRWKVFCFFAIFDVFFICHGIHWAINLF